jgi:tetratricopeptide (TPR) repeat protein
LHCDYFGETDMANTYINRGLVKVSLSASPADIVADYQEALNSDPRHTYAYFLLGEQYEGEQAIAYYSKAIELSPEYAIPYVKRGIIYQEQGTLQAAIADFEQVKTLAIHATWREEAERQLELLKIPPAFIPETPSLSPSIPDHETLPREMKEETP